MRNNVNNTADQVSDFVKNIRAYAGISQRELAKRTGITQSDISKMERGLANPSINTLSRLAKGAGVSMNIDFVINVGNSPVLIENWGPVEPKIQKVCKDAVEMILEEMGDAVEEIILYGSCARGENTEESDVDIAVLTDLERMEAQELSDKTTWIATKLMNKFNELVNFVCLPIKEYFDKKQWYPYYKNIDEDGVNLYVRRGI